MLTSAEAPASEGTLEAKGTENGNTSVTVRVKHLAMPSKLAADASTYVVWVTPRDGDAQNVGALTVDKDLEGKLETITPQRSFMVTVTPEPRADVTMPTHRPVFTGQVNRTE